MNPQTCPDSARVVQTRGPVDPGLRFPAVDLALLTWLRSPRTAGMLVATIELQTMSSTLGASERWSIIPATGISGKSQCNVVDVCADPSGAGIYTNLSTPHCGGTVYHSQRNAGLLPISLFNCVFLIVATVVLGSVGVEYSKESSPGRDSRWE